MSLRIGGYAAILGGILIGLVIVMTGGLTEGSDDAAAIVLLVGLAALLVALAGLSAFQARSDPWLVWGAFAMTAVGTVVTFVASVSDLAGVGPGDWRDGLLPIGLITAGLGSTLFGVATYRVSVLSRTGAVALAIGPVAMLIGAIAVSQNAWELGIPLTLVGIGQLPGRLVDARRGGDQAGSSIVDAQARLTAEVPRQPGPGTLQTALVRPEQCGLLEGLAPVSERRGMWRRGGGSIHIDRPAEEVFASWRTRRTTLDV